MAKYELPSPELLRQLLRYEPETGKLFWLPRPVEIFPTQRAAKSWNTRFAGKEAFSVFGSGGYLQGSIFGRLYLTHRVIWAMVTGSWPVEQLDHINHDRTNNRMQNMREASHKENGKNQSRPCSNTSGVTGVSWSKPENKWKAGIRVDGRQIHLGYFKDLASAKTARDGAAIKYGFHKNHGKDNLHE